MLYLVLGKSGHVFGGLIRTEDEAQQLAANIGGGYMSLIEPWDLVETQIRGQGRSPFGESRGNLTTMKVPREHLNQVRKYAVWLSHE